MNDNNTVLGIDIGGSGIKGAPVDIVSGQLLKPRVRIETPEPAEPAAMLDVIRQIIAAFEWTGDIGCGFPGVVKNGEVLTAANLEAEWLGMNIQNELSALSDGFCAVINDADAAGMAEMAFGIGKEFKGPNAGVVMMITLGTGIGTAMFVDGILVPNLELGHIEMKGKIAEHRAAAGVRKAEGLSWKKWGKRVNRYLKMIERLCNPDLFIIGGGVSKHAGEYFPYLKTRANIEAAQMLNEAGIVGAALTVPYMCKQLD
jgi:polyphosphate glucokinase